ncbi:MAG: hypothetical protein KAX49_14965 [Halanaerobiales bacterium]|nr:hypothetical protein [Halanaerobiales bacterium]
MIYAEEYINVQDNVNITRGYITFYGNMGKYQIEGTTNGKKIKLVQQESGSIIGNPFYFYRTKGSVDFIKGTWKVDDIDKIMKKVEMLIEVLVRGINYDFDITEDKGYEFHIESAAMSY